MAESRTSPKTVVLERSAAPPAEGRVVSIDALRGFDMFWLMGGQALVLAVAAFLPASLRNVLAVELEHSDWLGFTFWDFIAPLFLFVVGLSMPFAIERRLEAGGSRKRLYLHVIKRTLVLIALGLVFNGILELEFSRFRYTGVLQRIALSYFFAALIVIGNKLRGQVLWTAGLLLGYWAMMALIPAPGYHAGDFTPAGNLAGYLDRLFLPGHFCCYVYGDNEGYLSTIPSVATVMLGVLCGHLLRSPQPVSKKLKVLAAGGVLSLAAGLAWGAVFPIITRLWTSSYVLYANGWSMLLFLGFYWVIDVKGYRRWAFPFIVVGLNAILIYVVQNRFDFAHVANVVVGGAVRHAGVYQAILAAASVLAAKWLLLYFLYRKKIFLKA